MLDCSFVTREDVPSKAVEQARLYGSQVRKVPMAGAGSSDGGERGCFRTLRHASPKLLIGRYSQIGDVYSVTTATSEREPLFESEQSARLVIAAIRYCERSGLSESLAWVVMPEHVHWLFMLRRGTLGVCVQRFKSISARQINARISTQGLLWQRGYYEHRLRDDEDVLAQVRYIVTNPLRRGLAVRIEDYPY